MEGFLSHFAFFGVARPMGLELIFKFIINHNAGYKETRWLYVAFHPINALNMPLFLRPSKSEELVLRIQVIVPQIKEKSNHASSVNRLPRDWNEVDKLKLIKLEDLLNDSMFSFFSFELVTSELDVRKIQLSLCTGMTVKAGQ